ncbi:ABC transporter substrate-binding protein [soil metagenome]
MRKQILLTTLLMITLLITACGGGGSKTPTKGEAIVFVAVPLSGVQANAGQAVAGGVKLAAEEFNRNGGLLGYKIVVRALDDESNNDVALKQVDQVQQAISAGEHVLGVIGHMNSGQTLATMEHYKDMPIVVITPTASEQSLTKRGYTNFFRVNANDSVQAVIDADFLVKKLNGKRIAVLHNNSPYGKGLAETIIKELEQRGATIALNLEVAEAQTKFEKEVPQIKAANADTIFYAGYEIETAFLRSALRDGGINLPMLASDGAFVSTTIDESSGAAEGLYVSAFAPSPHNVADAKWFEAYQAVEYRNPDNFSINGYVAMQVLADGVQKANKLDASAIAQALHSGALNTLLKALTYEANGDLVDPKIWIYQVKDGEFQQVQ